MQNRMILIMVVLLSVMAFASIGFAQDTKDKSATTNKACCSSAQKANQTDNAACCAEKGTDKCCSAQTAQACTDKQKAECKTSDKCKPASQCTPEEMAKCQKSGKTCGR